MAYRIRVRVDYDWVPDGAGSYVLSQQQADQPGYGAVPVGGAGGVGQTASDIVGEAVAGGDSPTAGNLLSALNAAAADLYTRLTTAGSVPGFTAGTLLSVVQGWSTGNP